jgi:hypothetical protein
MTRQTHSAKNTQAAALLALALAWIVPGAGHIYLGRRARGLIILVTLAATFWAGVAVGGVMTVDARTERWWFAAQMCTGVHGLVGWQRQAREYDRMFAELQDEHSEIAPRYKYDLGKAQTNGPAYAAQVQQDYLDELQARDGVALKSPMDTVARSYTGIAGLLNLLCMFDALMLGLLGVRGEPARPARGTAGRAPHEAASPAGKPTHPEGAP